ncbi:CBS domain-containing protein, partial [bacterium]
VYTLGLLRKGVRIDRRREVEILEGVTVGEVMEAAPQTLRAGSSLEQAFQQLLAARQHGQAVLNEDGELFGMLALEDIERARQRQPEEALTVGAVCTRRPTVAYPDEPLAPAVQRMSNADVGRLPVVERGQPSRLVGMLRREDVVRAYQLAATRRAAERHAAGSRRLDAYTGLTVSSFVVQPGSACDGKKLSEIVWPNNGLVASIRRGAAQIVPHGETVLQPDDEIVTVHEEAARGEIERLCARGK